jgi:hypothetical protein
MFWYVIIVKIGIFYKKHFSIDFVKFLGITYLTLHPPSCRRQGVFGRIRGVLRGISRTERGIRGVMYIIPVLFYNHLIFFDGGFYENL